jgi:TonB family protein
VNSLGKDAMIAHVQNGTSAFAYLVDAQTLRSGKVHLTVDKAGTVSGVRLSESSGYPALDARVLELLNTLPGTWSAASNAAGEAVEQEFVFSFGTVGC